LNIVSTQSIIASFTGIVTCYMGEGGGRGKGGKKEGEISI
jgi:hypothetical protein